MSCFPLRNKISLSLLFQDGTESNMLCVYVCVCNQTLAFYFCGKPWLYLALTPSSGLPESRETLPIQEASIFFIGHFVDDINREISVVLWGGINLKSCSWFYFAINSYHVNITCGYCCLSTNSLSGHSFSKYFLSAYHVSDLCYTPYRWVEVWRLEWGR